LPPFIDSPPSLQILCPPPEFTYPIMVDCPDFRLSPSPLSFAASGKRHFLFRHRYYHAIHVISHATAIQTPFRNRHATGTEVFLFSLSQRYTLSSSSAISVAFHVLATPVLIPQIFCRRASPAPAQHHTRRPLMSTISCDKLPAFLPRAGCCFSRFLRAFDKTIFLPYGVATSCLFY